MTYRRENVGFACCFECVCVTLSLTVSEERRLTVFENRVLRRIFRPKRDEIGGKWRRLYNEELYDL